MSRKSSKKCSGCAGVGMPEGLSEEDKKKLVEMQKRQMEVQKAFMDALKPYLEEYQNLLKEIKTCKDCKETKYQFVPCEPHLSHIEELNKTVSRLQLSFKLKQELQQLPE